MPINLFISSIGRKLFLPVSMLMLCQCASQPPLSQSSKDLLPTELQVDQIDWPTRQAEQAVQLQSQCRDGYGEAFTKLTGLLTRSFDKDMAFLKAIDELDRTVDYIYSWAYLQAHVHPDAEVREVGDYCEQVFSKLYTEYSLSKPVYSRLSRIDRDSLSAIDQCYLDKMLSAFQLSGVDRDEATRTRIKALNDELTVIGQQFSKNMREDTRTVVLDKKDLLGLPADYIASHPADENGKVKITTEYPDYMPFMQYAESDLAKKKLYVAFRSRGYPENKEVLMSLLEKRYEFAQLMDYPSFAHYITSDKMIGSPENAREFIDKINQLAKPASSRDDQVLLKRLQKIEPKAKVVQDWQKTYLENLVKNEDYKLDAQEVREYFSYTKVRDGIFGLVQDMFGVQIKPWNTSVWHESVESWAIWQGGELLGQFYLDMHPREGKYGHAAAFGVREGVKGLQTPIKALVCNFPGGGEKVGLLEHSQVETFLHEFGHLLHGIFSGQQPWLALSGISTERDFVEAPSQMLEEWVWDKDTLKTFAVNQQGETIPDALIEKMQSARFFGMGQWVRHQMYYAALSLSIYDRPPSKVDLDAFTKDLQNEYSPFPYVDDTYMYASFDHLDGYSAMYYTYMWSLVIASDMFSEFKKSGLRDTAVAKRYKDSVLSAGSSKPAAELVKDFLGRDYRFESFADQLKSAGD